MPITWFRPSLVVKILTALLAVIVVLAAHAAPTWAADGEAIAPTTARVVTFSVVTWVALQSFVVPLIVGIVTKATASSPLKAVVNIVVNALGSLLGSVVVLNDVATISTATLGLWAMSTIGAIALHYGIWKPVGATGSNPRTNILAPGSGLGG